MQNREKEKIWFVPSPSWPNISFHMEGDCFLSHQDCKGYEMRSKIPTDTTPICDVGTIDIGNMTSLAIRVSEILGIPKNNKVFSSTTSEVHPHTQELQTVAPRHTSDCVQEIGILNSNSKLNFNGTIFGEPPMEKANIVATTVF
ncbi:hypothetical protein Tco_1417127 [Tanacetum coccineum]